MEMHREWRVTWRELDIQGGYWPMKPKIFDNEKEARRFFRDLKAREGPGKFFDGATKDVKLSEDVVVSRIKT